MMLIALVMSPIFGIALTLDGINITVAIMKMQVWNVTNTVRTRILHLIVL
jgi:hypothetical protein